jgi:acetyl esterase
MPIDPAAQFVCDVVATLPSPWDMPTAAEARAAAKAHPRDRFVTSVDHIEERRIPGPHGDIPVRIYHPKSTTPLPVIMYFHGGGWVICDLDTHDSVCRDLAFLVNAIVVSVDYRMAPEHKFPIPVDDCLAATTWCAANAASFGGNAKRLAVAGDSAGGNLATVVAMRIRDEGGPTISFQGLVYPATGSPWDDRESYRRNGKGYFLTHEAMLWFTSHYMRSKVDTDSPYFAPLRAKSLAGMPPALVQTCEFDPLLDEGVAYAKALAAAGVPCEQITYPGLIHAAFGMDDVIPASWQMQTDLAAALRTALHP